MALVLKDRVLETSTSTGTGAFALGGAQTGFQSFSVIGSGNTTYYTIQGKNADGTLTGEWEVGVGTYTTGSLARDTVLSNSLGTTAKIVFSAGAKDVFCDYPASKSVNQNADNKVIIPYTPGVTNVGSLNVGDATAHTDSGVIAAFTASEPLYLYTSLQNTSSANTSYASYAVNDGGHTSYGELGINNSNYSYSAAGYPNNTFSAPLATFVESYGGPLAIGTWDSQKISFIVNGSVNTADAMTINADGTITIPSLTASTAIFTDASNNLISKDVTGSNRVVLNASPMLSGNVGIGTTGGTPIAWSSSYNSLQVGKSSAIGGLVSSNEVSISSNLKFQTTWKYVSNDLASRYYQNSGSHYWATDTGTGIANDPALLNDVMVLDNFGNLNINGTLTGQNASVETLFSPTGFLSVNTGGIGSTYIGATGSSYTTLLDDDFIKLTSLTPSQAVFTDGSKNLVSVATTGSGNAVLSDSPTFTTAITTAAITATGSLQLTGSTAINQNIATSQTTGTLNIGGASATGTITLGRSTGAQTVNIATGVTAASTTKAVNIGTAGNATSTTNIAIGSTTGTSTTTFNGKTSGRIVPRVSTTTSSATPTINTDNVDMYGLTAQAVDITSFTTNLSGTPTDGQKLWIYIVGTAARAITWGASFESSTATLPTTTVSTNRLDVGFVWNTATTKWRCVAVA